MKKVVNPSMVLENGKDVEIIYDAEVDEEVTIIHPSLKLLRQSPNFRDQMEELFDEIFLEDKYCKDDIRLVGSDGTVICGNNDIITVDMEEEDKIEYFLPLIMAAASAAPQVMKLAKGFFPKKKKKGKNSASKASKSKVSKETETVEGQPVAEEETEQEEPKKDTTPKLDSLSSILNIANMLAGAAGTDISGITDLAKTFLKTKNQDPDYQADLYDTFVRAAKGLDN